MKPEMIKKIYESKKEKRTQTSDNLEKTNLE